MGKALSDTGKALEAIQRDLQDISRELHITPAPVVANKSTEAEEEEAHRYRCYQDGPACVMGKEMKKIEARVKSIEDARIEERGERKAQRKLITWIVAGGAVVNGLLSAAALIWRMRGH